MTVALSPSELGLLLVPILPIDRVHRRGASGLARGLERTRALDRALRLRDARVARGRELHELRESGAGLVVLLEGDERVRAVEVELGLLRPDLDRAVEVGERLLVAAG